MIFSWSKNCTHYSTDLVNTLDFLLCALVTKMGNSYAHLDGMMQVLCRLLDFDKPSHRFENE